MDVSIIIVDDLDYQCELVEDLLREYKYKDISSFTNPQTAISKIDEISKQGKEVFIITDFSMPELNGYELLEKFESTPNVRGVIMTSVPSAVKGAKFQVLDKNYSCFFKTLNSIISESSILS